MTRCIVFSIILSITAETGRAGEFFNSPQAAFALTPKEEVRTLRLSGGTAEKAQSKIDAARKAAPDAALRIEVTGTLEVGRKPLQLASRMILSLSPTACIKAADNCSAPALITIAESEHVAVHSPGPGPAMLDGRGKVPLGISIIRGIRINIDQLRVTGCREAGIDCQGRDASAVNEAVSMTRCQISGNGDGLRVRDSAAFMCLNNEFTNQTGTALAINSLTSIVAGNNFAGNKWAIRSGSDRGVVTRNLINDPAALELTRESRGNLVTENHSNIAGLTLTLGGRRQEIFRNTLAGRATVLPDTKEILLLGNKNLSVHSPSPGLKVFNPPTFGSPHTDPVIVPGMGRFDLTVIGAKALQKEDPVAPVDLATVQQALTAARAAHPDDVIVLKLEGEYLSRSPQGLELPPNTCVILEGRILADLGIPLEPLWKREAPLTQLIKLPESGFSSVSGGTLDGSRQAFFPINANTGSTALIEGVTLTAGAREGLNTKGRAAADPLYIYQSHVLANNGRGIWAHVATRIRSIANVCDGNRMDGIDLDAASVDGIALFNNCSGNRRHGIFIEEAVSHNIAFGNTLLGNSQAGVHVWNEEVVGNTGKNVVASNECTANRRGVSVGGRAVDKTANANLFFNNVCRDNRLDGILSGNSRATGNYFSQCVVGQNHESDIFHSDTSFFLNIISPAADSIHHAQGELSGEVTATSVILQSRLTSIPGPALDPTGDIPGKQGAACFEWSLRPDFADAKRTPWMHSSAASDFIVRAKLDHLTPATIHYYRLVLGPDEFTTRTGPTRQFKTLNPSDAATSVSFCVGSCMNYHVFMNGLSNGGNTITATHEDKQLGYPAFAAMHALKPDFFIGTGDIVYYDFPAKTPARTLPQLRKKWHEQFRFPRMVDFFGDRAVYWSKDDHDFRFDDADLTGKILPLPTSGIEVFREQLPTHPAGDVMTPSYRTQRVHKHLQLWFMEGRDFRSDNAMPDGPGKSIWGKEQAAWLQRTLKESDATWKIIINPTPMVGPDRANKSDNHTNPKGFRHEADTFFQWLVDEKITNVLTFCGDRHWQYHSIHPLGVEEFSVGALNDENSIAGMKSGDPKSTDPQGLIKQPFIYAEPSGGFLHVTIGAGKKATPELQIEFRDDTGKVLHKVMKSGTPPP
jgi:alkaline phosphatase/alkaline phosphatase D